MTNRADRKQMIRYLSVFVLCFVLLPAGLAEAQTLSLTSAKRSAKAKAYREIKVMDRDGRHATLNAGPVCKRLASDAVRCGYRLQTISEGLLTLIEHHVLVTLDHGYALARRVGKERAYAQGYETVPRLRA